MNLRPCVLPVHCCCHPARRLGWVSVPVKRVGPIRFRIGQTATSLWNGQATEEQYIDTEIAILEGRFSPHCSELAVKSGDVSIEQWRKVFGFVEDPQWR